ncbi:MAG: hypothetical protein KBD60_04100 [Sterolibacterium sp.]|jgi:hypothetical protein|nr:hypothetical protein [Sterolibacterium sp.]
MDFSAISTLSPSRYADAALPRARADATAQARPQSTATGEAVDGVARSKTDPTDAPRKIENPADKSAGLTPAQQDEVRQLQKRDQAVRQHEMAHLAASGGLATSGAIYSFQRGPDGQSYAVGGEVHIDVSPGRTPQETVTRAQTVIAAALAPADPSGQDRAVAAQARQMQQQAMGELMTAQRQQAVPGAQDRHAGLNQYRQMAGNAATTPEPGSRVSVTA